MVMTMVEDEEKGFEGKIKAMISSRACACQTGILEKKKSGLRYVNCKGCGKLFKTDRDTDYCMDCEKKMK